MSGRVSLVVALLWSVTIGCVAPGSRPTQTPNRQTTPGDTASLGVRIDSLTEVPGLAPPAWAFVSTELAAIGHPELVLLVQRSPNESASAPPSEGVRILSALVTTIKKGRRLKEWEMAGLPAGMFGRHDLTGIILGGPVPDPRVQFAAETMTVILITEDELQVAFRFGPPRVTNLLGEKSRFFPYPPWFDRGRRSVCTPAEMNDAPIAAVGTRSWVQGAAVWQSLRAPQSVTLRLTADAANKMAAVLRKVADNPIAFFSMAPAPEVWARVVWRPLGARPAAISATQGETTAITGSFVVLAASAESSGAQVTEDGFTLFISEDRWPKAVAALEAGQAFEIPATKDALPFAVVVDSKR